MNNINIFVSSTCYDLSQLRVDLSDFIKHSGHNPILSEFENFPISPELSTIENCIKIVKENADILILIVGNRYGSLIDNGKSITNNEFLVAKEKGIPIFCFIDKSTLNALNFWKDNKDGNFSNIVDNKQIFEFIDDIRNNSKIWTFPFEKAQDIINTVKVQLSYLFKNSLKAKKIFDQEISEFFKLNLSSKAIKILLDKDTIYEYEYFAQILVDEINKKEFLKNDIEYSILVEPKHFIKDYHDIPNWISNRLTTISNIVNGLTSIVNKALPDFLKETGTPADLKGLFYVAQKYAELYEQIQFWIIETRSTSIGEDFEHIKFNLSGIADNIERDLWSFPFKIHEEISRAKSNFKNGEKEQNLNLVLDLHINKNAIQSLYDDFEKLKKYYSS